MNLRLFTNFLMHEKEPEYTGSGMVGEFIAGLNQDEHFFAVRKLKSHV
jgi:hypothetical protein